MNMTFRELLAALPDPDLLGFVDGTEHFTDNPSAQWLRLVFLHEAARRADPNTPPPDPPPLRLDADELLKATAWLDYGATRMLADGIRQGNEATVLLAAMFECLRQTLMRDIRVH